MNDDTFIPCPNGCPACAELIKLGWIPVEPPDVSDETIELIETMKEQSNGR